MIDLEANHNEIESKDRVEIVDTHRMMRNVSFIFIITVGILGLIYSYLENRNLKVNFNLGRYLQVADSEAAVAQAAIGLDQANAALQEAKNAAHQQTVIDQTAAALIAQSAQFAMKAKQEVDELTRKAASVSQMVEELSKQVIAASSAISGGANTLVSNQIVQSLSVDSNNGQFDADEAAMLAEVEANSVNQANNAEEDGISDGSTPAEEAKAQLPAEGEEVTAQGDGISDDSTPAEEVEAQLPQAGTENAAEPMTETDEMAPDPNEEVKELVDTAPVEMLESDSSNVNEDGAEAEEDRFLDEIEKYLQFSVNYTQPHLSN